ncbi:hypothetical protein V6N11_046652 [Hibiscus sabdariffa]|uniref:Uncharacterized protein n=2 Tax=Hibiscus sabdariffa TaxID=183260 RepID=A0ABR2BW35_9ROSI
MMNERGAKKVIGSSNMKLQGEVNEIRAGGRDHLESKEMYTKVGEMLERIRAVRYVSSEGEVQELDEEEEKYWFRLCSPFQRWECSCQDYWLLLKN